MNLQWILSPLALYVFLASALVASLVFFISLKREMHKERIRALKANDRTRSDLDALAGEVKILGQAVREIEERPASPVPAASLDLTKRAHALRMCRRGESVHTIAAAVKAPQNEVVLLLKIEELLKRVQKCA